jgi:hypothetical protein
VSFSTATGDYTSNHRDFWPIIWMVGWLGPGVLCSSVSWN